MKILEKKLFFTLGLVLCMGTGLAQHNSNQEERTIRVMLGKLRESSVEYDKYEQLSNKYEQQKNEAKQKYVDIVSQIKHEPNREKFVNFLNKATGVDSIQYRDKKAYSYTYNHSLHNPRISKMPTLLEYYKVVKYSLFDRDKDELLPPKDIPFLRYKEW